MGAQKTDLARRERAVMLQACGKGIILWTLRYGDEVRQPKEVFGDIAERKADPKLVTLVQKVIDERSTPWDPSMVSDPVQENLKELIAARQKKNGRARKPKRGEEPEPPSNVVSIMDALKKSISGETKKRG